jgi:hypothetical protein
MKKIGVVLIILIALVVRGVLIERQNAQVWPTVWQNFRDTESVVGLIKETFLALGGQQIKRVPMSIREMNTIVYRWRDKSGKIHLSYQKPVDVENVEEVRLGDLNYKIEPSLTEEEKARLLNKKP